MTRPRPRYRHGHRGRSSSATWHGSPQSARFKTDGSEIPTENRSNSDYHYRERVSTDPRAAKIQTAAYNLTLKACELYQNVRNRQRRNETWENIKKILTRQNVNAALMPDTVDIGELTNDMSELSRDEIQTIFRSVELYGMDERSRVNLNRMFAGLCRQSGGSRRTHKRRSRTHFSCTRRTFLPCETAQARNF